jgi:hypothetical protein
LYSEIENGKTESWQLSRDAILQDAVNTCSLFINYSTEHHSSFQELTDALQTDQPEQNEAVTFELIRTME